MDAQKREVYLKVSILNILEVDTLKETFTADVFYQTRWREPSLDGHKVGSYIGIEVSTEKIAENFWNNALRALMQFSVLFFGWYLDQPKKY